MSEQPGEFHAWQAPPESMLCMLVLCDIADSTAVVERLGDNKAVELMRQHDQLARTLIRQFEGRELDRTDGFLVLFERPIHGVWFALSYLHALRSFADGGIVSLNARVGVHFGELTFWRNSPGDLSSGAKLRDVEGLALPITARLMSLAMPGQILLSGVAYELAERAMRDSENLEGKKIRWVAHGHYFMKGLPEPMPVFEVGELGFAPLSAPRASAKARPVRPLWRSVKGPVLVLVAILAGVAIFVLHGEPELAVSDRDWIVLGDFVSTSGNKALEDSLGTAFRIGIEASRHINVLPEFAVRQTLARMERDGSTRIDRVVGSEIAIREHARAVILPSIAQYGTKMRLVAELVDPRGLRTVSTQAVDVDDANEVLSAMDSLLRSMRSRLGESLRQLESSTQPLEKAVTPNLEALQALSRAMQLRREGKWDQAEKVLWYAIELDPRFATAYARLGALLFSQQRYSEARNALEKGLGIKDRLSERERVYATGLLASFKDPMAMLDSWRLFANLFPRQGTGQHNTGNVYYMYLLDLRNAEAAFNEAAAESNPLRNYTFHALGHVLLAQEKYSLAEQRFREAHAMSPAVANFGLSDALTAQGKFDDAHRYLNEVKRQEASSEFERELRRTTLQIAQGELHAAAATVNALLSNSQTMGTRNDRWRVMSAAMALHSALGRVEEARKIASDILIGSTIALKQNPEVNQGTVEHLLYAAGWASRLGMSIEASAALALATELGSFDRHPVRARLAALVQAELDLIAGKVEIVKARLEVATNQPALWENHELLARAASVSGDVDAETRHLKWMVSRPGLAYAQWSEQFLGQQARALALRNAAIQLQRRTRQ